MTVCVIMGQYQTRPSSAKTADEDQVERTAGEETPIIVPHSPSITPAPDPLAPVFGSPIDSEYPPALDTVPCLSPERQVWSVYQ